MNVSELIELLETYDGTQPVCFLVDTPSRWAEPYDATQDMGGCVLINARAVDPS